MVMNKEVGGVEGEGVWSSEPGSKRRSRSGDGAVCGDGDEGS